MKIGWTRYVNAVYHRTHPHRAGVAVKQVFYHTRHRTKRARCGEEISSFQRFQQTSRDQIEAWHKDILARSAKDDALQADEQYGPYLFRSIRSQGDNYHVIYRTPLHNGSPTHATTKKQEVVIDMNEIGAIHPGAILCSLKPSPDHKLVGFLVDIDGHDHRQLFVRDIESGQIAIIKLPQHVHGGVVGFDWAVGPNHGYTLYIAVAEHDIRSNIVLRTNIYRHSNGSVSFDPSSESILSKVASKIMKQGSESKLPRDFRPIDIHKVQLTTATAQEVFREADDAFFVDVTSTKDGRFIVVSSNSKNTSQLTLFDALNPESHGCVLFPRTPGIVYFIDSLSTNARAAAAAAAAAGGGDDNNIIEPQELLVASNCRTGPSGNLELFTVPMSLPLKPLSSDELTPIHPIDSSSTSSSSILQDLDAFSAGIMLYQLSPDGLPVLRFLEKSIGNRSSTQWSIHDVPVDVPGKIFAVEPGVNKEFTSSSVRFEISSPTSPARLWEYSLAAKTLSTQQKANDSSNYTANRIQIPSWDNENVPLTLVSLKQRILSGQPQPCLLLGYGAYGVNMDLGYHPDLAALVGAGWLLAIAHVRGGAEKGLPWYHAGRQMNKWNTFRDFTKCAEYLIDHRYTEPKKLCASGMSAGALIMGVMANEYADMFRALIFRYPFLDVLGAMQDDTSSLTIHEHEEWGNIAQDPQIRTYIESYSCIQNIKSQAYPNMLITAATNDTRVNLEDSYKWIEGIRKCAINNPTVYLQLIKGDHYGPRSLLDSCYESAIECTFLTQQIEYIV